MNFMWLIRNAAASWRRRASLLDAAKRFLWIYSPKLGWLFSQREWSIGFRYPSPIGEIHLNVRGNTGSDAFIHSEVFEHQYYQLPLAIAPQTILDLGANIGFTAVYFGRLFPNAYIACVEPYPDNVRLLERNLAANGVRGTILSAAIDCQDGSAVIELDPMNYGHRVNINAGACAGPTLVVKAVSVPTICRHLGWSRIGLLKVDIEGHEKVLFSRDCDWLHRVDAMCVEWHDELGKVELERLADRFGFSRPLQLPGIWFMAR